MSELHSWLQIIYPAYQLLDLDLNDIGHHAVVHTQQHVLFHPLLYPVNRNLRFVYIYYFQVSPVGVRGGRHVIWLIRIMNCIKYINCGR